MKKYILSLACLAALGAQAQNIYEIEKVGATDLIGTARYVGMGGAMNALGADLSTMSGNPAATGLYRRYDFALTASALGQSDAEKMGGQGRIRGSFDQMGAVLALRTGSSKVPFFNIGFNYQKSHNLKQFFGTDWINLGGLSMTHQLADQLYGAAYGFQVVGGNDFVADFPNYNSIVSNGAYDAGLIGMETDQNGFCTDVLSPAQSTAYRFKRANWGRVGEYDINFSANVKDRAYFGLTAGIYEVNSCSSLYYEEIFKDAPYPGAKDESFGLAESTRLRGTGFDMKFGAIFRPIEESPFRFGIAFHTPRILSLTQEKYAQFDSNKSHYCDPDDAKYDQLATGEYDYYIRTPWRLQLSAATTVSNWLALDAEYELANFKRTAIKYPTRYSYDGPSITDADKDYFVADEINYSMRPQHTFRLGVEARFAEQFYGRIGYNFVSSAFKKDQALLNLAEATTSGDYTELPNCTYNATSTDYINLGNTNRLTLGLGWHGKNCYFDVAYICQNQKADGYGFLEGSYDADGNLVGNQLAPFTKSIVRQSGVFTFGVKF